ncbi:MAG TPA: serine hydrolase, partial [Rubricoccaceae bacterium]|nr:serine hydrolase [Rubricoccaceae bacterium]
MDAFVSETLEALGAVPGLAVAVVRGDEVVYLRGFGLADREAGAEVTPDTPFYIASATKPFTALAAVLLDRQGALDLDASLASLFPDVAFVPEVGADSVTVRHLLSHTHGLDNDPIVFRAAFSGEHTPETMRALLAETAPNEDAPPGTFRYTNVGYNILSLRLDALAGGPWQDLLDALLFEPLGMDHTTAYASEAARWSPAAPYHPFGEDGPERIYLQKTDATMQAAGGMYASARDLARWLLVHLNGGRLDGRQVLPAAALAEAHRPVAEVDDRYGPFERRGYGLGWYTGPYDGEPVLHHFGGFAGAHAHLSFMPERGLGVVVLANESIVAGRLVPMIAAFAYDWWRGEPDVVALYTAQRDALVAGFRQARDGALEEAAERARRKWTLSLPFEAYAGTYVSPLYGTLTVAVEGEAPVLRIGNLWAEATPFTEPETMRVTFVPPQGEVVAFELDAAGRPARARYHGVVFERFE